MVVGFGMKQKNAEDNSRAWEQRTQIQDLVIKKLLIKNSLQALWIDERTQWKKCTNDYKRKAYIKAQKLKRLSLELKTKQVIFPLK
jgi:hypothetical protein